MNKNLNSIRYFYFLPLLLISGMARANCYINLPLSCSGGSHPPWAKHSILARTNLFLNNEVQTNLNSCDTFTKLIKSECEITTPIQNVFTDADGNKLTTFVVQGDNDLFANRTSLPQAFQTYFADNGLGQAQLDNLTAFISIGTNNFSAIYDFASPTNKNTSLTLPMNCMKGNWGPHGTTACGWTVSCGSSKTTTGSDSVGNFIQIDKSSGGQFCSNQKLVQELVSAIQSVQDKMNAEPADKIVTYTDQPASTDFAGFGSNMPIINQSNPELQRLLVDKYGSNYDYTQIGTCLPTALASLAIAMKSVSPGSILNNLFDITPGPNGSAPATIPLPMQYSSPSPNLNIDNAQSMNVSGPATTPDSKGGFTQQQYSGYASYVDEMLRAGGLLDGRWPQLNDFRFFFSSDTDKYTNWSSQDDYKSNIQGMIRAKKGVALTLLSDSGIKNPTNKSVTAHENVVISFSGDNLTLMDPWGVVNQVGFSTKTYSGSIQVVAADGNVLLSPQTARTVLVHNGLQAGYVGNNDFAYILDVFHVKPWPAAHVLSDVESTLGTANLSQTKQSGQTCTPFTLGSMSVAGANYTFRNPMSLVKSTPGLNASTLYSSTTPVTAGCSNFKDDQGTIKNLVGTFTFTCNQSQINVVSNSCQVIPTSCSVSSVSHGSGVYAPTQAMLGTQSYFSDMGKCVLTGCADGYSLNTSTNSCECKFIESTTMQSLAGTISSTGQCQFSQANCPTGTAYAGTMPTSGHPICLKAGTYVASFDGSVSTVLGPDSGSQLPLTDVNGKTLAQLASISGHADNYQIDKTGHLVPLVQGKLVTVNNLTYPTQSFKNCPSDLLSKSVNTTNGTTTCTLNEGWYKQLSDDSGLITQLKNSMTSSTGRKADGSCKDGFRNDYANEFCVAKLAVCDYLPGGLGAMGLRTFDPDADSSCRFMGCVEGYTMLTYSTTFVSSTMRIPIHKNCVDPLTCDFVSIPQPTPTTKGLNSYYCAKGPSYTVASDKKSVTNSVAKVTITNKVKPDTLSVSPPLLKTTDQFLMSMRLTTALDCNKFDDPNDLIRCQLDAVGNMNTTRRDLTTGQENTGLDDAISGIINSKNLARLLKGDMNWNTGYDSENLWRQKKIAATMSNSTTNASFNCGGPDSMALDGYGGRCAQNWSKTWQTFGECFIPNGKGQYQAGKGCVVTSCFDGFQANPSNRACLDLKAPCYRPDMPSGSSYDAYLADVNLDGNYNDKVLTNSKFPGPVARFSKCMIASCKSGTTFVDFVRPISWGFSSTGSILSNGSFDTSTGPIYSPSIDASNKMDIPQYTDLCLSSGQLATYNSQKAKGFVNSVNPLNTTVPQNTKVLPGQWCRMSGGHPGVGAEGVFTYANGKGQLDCTFIGCNKMNYNNNPSPQGIYSNRNLYPSSSYPVCEPASVDSNGKLLSSVKIDSCISTTMDASTGGVLLSGNASPDFMDQIFVSADRSKCLVAPVMYWGNIQKTVKHNIKQICTGEPDNCRGYAVDKSNLLPQDGFQHSTAWPQEPFTRYMTGRRNQYHGQFHGDFYKLDISTGVKSDY